MTELSTEAVQALFGRCLIKLPETPDEDVYFVDGVVLKVAFSKKAIEEHHEEIAALLAELPEQFRADHGGGWSFLNACNDRHGAQWTSFHRTMDELFMLGRAAGFVTELLPRDMWDALPGGMPYYVIKGLP